MLPSPLAAIAIHGTLGKVPEPLGLSLVVRIKRNFVFHSEQRPCLRAPFPLFSQMGKLGGEYLCLKVYD